MVPIYRSKQAFSAARPSNSPRNTIPVPSEIRVPVKIRARMAMITPMVASLAVRVRNIKRVCPRYFRSGRLSKKAGTPEVKLRKKPKRNTMIHPAPRMPRGRLPAMIRQVPTMPSTMEKAKSPRRFPFVWTTTPSFCRSK